MTSELEKQLIKLAQAGGVSPLECILIMNHIPNFNMDTDFPNAPSEQVFDTHGWPDNG